MYVYTDMPYTPCIYPILTTIHKVIDYTEL